MRRKVLIINDDSSSADRLRSALLEFDNRLDIHGPLQETDEVTRELSTVTDYNVIISSFRLNDGDALEVFRKVRPLSLVMFASPCDEPTMQKVRHMGENYVICDGNPESILRAMDQIWQASIRLLGTRRPPKAMSYRDRVLVTKKGHMIPLKIEDVHCFHVVDRNIIALDSKGHEYVCSDGTLDSLEKILPPHKFLRLNRQHLVHRNAIKEYCVLPDSRAQVWLKCCDDDCIYISKARSKEFRKWVDTEEIR